MVSNKESELSNILVSLPQESFSTKIVNILSQNLTVINISKKKEKSSFNNIVNISSANTLNKIKEKLDYALVFIDNKEDVKTLKKITQKLLSDRTKTAVILNQKNINKLLKDSEKTIKQLNPSLAIRGEILCENHSNESSKTSKIFHNAIRKKEIYIHNNPLENLFLFSEDDMRKALFKLLFTESDKRVNNLLFYEHPQTYISACNKVSKVLPETTVKFEKAKRKTSQTNHQQLIKAITPILEKSPKYFTQGIEGFEKFIEKIHRNKSFINTQYKNKSADGAKKERAKFVGITVALAIICFVASNITLTYTSAVFALSALKNVNEANINQSKEDAIKSKGLFKSSWPITSKFAIFSNNKTFQSIETFSYAIEEIADIYGGFASNPNSLLNDPSSTLSRVTSLYFKLSKLNIDVNGSNQTLARDIKGASKIASIMQVAPEVLGVKSEKKYLLLFQNNNELRPSGGFIGSIGEISFSGSEITDFKIRDVYQLDGQLTQHVEPHYIVRRHLQPHLYLRDSNFDLNFSESASKAAQLYYLETQKKVDGVVAVNFNALEQIVKEIGPITLHDYNITLTEKNLFEFINNTIESNFYPGSSQKQDVLNSLATHIKIRFEQNPELYTKVASLLPSLLEEKNIMFAFQNKNIHNLFEANGFTGNITDDRKNTEKTINDILYINEANIGANKANVAIQRKVDYEIFLASNELVSKSTLHVFNNSQNSQEYKAYIRVVTPKGSRVQWVKINDQKQTIIPAITEPEIYESENFKPQDALEVEQRDSQNYTVFGMIITTPKNSTNKIEILYTNGLKQNFINPIAYSIKYIKQPGTKEYTLNTTIHTESDADIKSQTFESIDSNTFTSTQIIKTDTTQEVTITSR